MSISNSAYQVINEKSRLLEGRENQAEQNLVLFVMRINNFQKRKN
jgi:hypothetical protein